LAQRNAGYSGKLAALRWDVFALFPVPPTAQDVAAKVDVEISPRAVVQVKVKESMAGDTEVSVVPRAKYKRKAPNLVSPSVYALRSMGREERSKELELEVTEKT